MRDDGFASARPSVPDYSSLLRLDGSGFVVVGAGQGIGREATLALHSAGAGLFCVDVDAGWAEKVAAEVGGTPWVADARDRTAAEETVKAAERALGRIDGLVDVVGMSRFAALLNLSDEDFDWTFDMVLRHVYLFTQVIGRSMVASRNGTMVFVSSVAGFSSAPRHAAYGAAKAGLNSLVRSAAVELGPHRVRVNAVAPGVVRTPRVTEALGGERLLAEFAEQIPLGSVAQIADIAAAILFLSSRLASHITGQTLVVDGGASVQYPYPSRLLP